MRNLSISHPFDNKQLILLEFSVISTTFVLIQYIRGLEIDKF